MRWATLLLTLALAGCARESAPPAKETAPDDPQRQERAAAAAIEKLGGKVEKDMEAPGQPVVKVSLPTCTCLRDESDLAHLEALTDLRRLELRNDCKSSHLTDNGLSHLRKLTRLEYLVLGDSAGGHGITDAGLEHLKGLTSLRELVLGDNRGVTEAGVADLQKSLPRATIRRR